MTYTPDLTKYQQLVYGGALVGGRPLCDRGDDVTICPTHLVALIRVATWPHVPRNLGSG